MSVADFIPEIPAFTCNYCGYMAADTAGALHHEYPANVKLIRLPCTGKTDVQYLLDAFEQGADGVYIVACSLGNCHHVRGNERGRGGGGGGPGGVGPNGPRAGRGPGGGWSGGGGGGGR